MRRWKASILIAVLAAVCLGQTASEWDSHEINAIARKLKCSCGCKLDMSCQMPPQPCPVCKAAKMKMYNMKASGMPDSQIVDQFVAQGTEPVIPPGTAGMVGPYVALVLGLGFLILMIRRFRRQTPAPAAEVDPAMLDRIEKDLAKLD